MSERIEALKRELKSARETLNKVLDQIGDRWDEPVYSEQDSWTTRQLLTHIMTAGAGQARLMRNVAEGRGGVPDDFDLNFYNRRQVEKNEDLSVEEVRQKLEENYASLHEWLDGLDDAALDASGRHGSGREMTVESMIRNGIAAHERTHAKDIARALSLTL